MTRTVPVTFKHQDPSTDDQLIDKTRRLTIVPSKGEYVVMFTNALNAYTFEVVKVIHSFGDDLGEEPHSVDIILGHEWKTNCNALTKSIMLWLANFSKPPRILLTWSPSRMVTSA